MEKIIVKFVREPYKRKKIFVICSAILQENVTAKRSVHDIVVEKGYHSNLRKQPVE